MRNRYPGKCLRCGAHVAAGNGHFERRMGMWFVRCLKCVRVPPGVAAKLKHAEAHGASKTQLENMTADYQQDERQP